MSTESNTELMQILEQLKLLPQLPTKQDYYEIVCKETNWRFVVIPHPPFRFYRDDEYENRPKPWEPNFWEWIIKHKLDTIMIPTLHIPLNCQLNYMCRKPCFETGYLPVKVINIAIQENEKDIPIPIPKEPTFWKWMLFHDLVLDVDNFPILKQMKKGIDVIKNERPFESYSEIYGNNF